MHCSLSTSTTHHLDMSLCHIPHIGELHQIPAIANVVFELALPSFCHQGGKKGGIPFSKDTTGSDSTGGQGAVGPIGGQDSPLTLNLQNSHHGFMLSVFVVVLIGGDKYSIMNFIIACFDTNTAIFVTGVTTQVLLRCLYAMLHVCMHGKQVLARCAHWY